MKSVAITRQDEAPGRDTAIAASFTIHLPPYNDFPLLKMHVHPRFAVFDLGRKIYLLPLHILSDFVKELPVLLKALRIYEKWVASRPASSMTDKAYNPPAPSSEVIDELNSISLTNPCRLQVRRRYQDPNLSKSLCLSKSCRQASMGLPCVLEETLGEHNRSSDKFKWSKKSIRLWMRLNSIHMTSGSAHEL